MTADDRTRLEIFVDREVEHRARLKARHTGTTIDELVRQALTSYVRMPERGLATDDVLEGIVAREKADDRDPVMAILDRRTLLARLGR